MKALLIAAVLLAGCASMPSMRAKAPDVTLESAKTARQVGECIAQGWQPFGPMINQGGTATGYTVSLPVIGLGVQALADMVTTPSGSTVRVWYRLPYGNARYTEVVRQCAD